MAFVLKDPITGNKIEFASSDKADEYLRSIGYGYPPSPSVTTTPTTISTPQPPQQALPTTTPTVSKSVSTPQTTAPKAVVTPAVNQPVISSSNVSKSSQMQQSNIPPVPTVPQDIIDWGQAPPGYYYDASGQLVRIEAQVYDTTGKQVNYLSTPTGIYSPQINPSETNVRMIQTLPAFTPARITVSANTPIGAITNKILTSQEELAKAAPYIVSVSDRVDLPTTRLSESQIRPSTGLPSWYDSGIRPINPQTGELLTGEEEIAAREKIKSAKTTPTTPIQMQTSSQNAIQLGAPLLDTSGYILNRVQKVFSPTGDYIGDELIDIKGVKYGFRPVGTNTVYSPQTTQSYQYKSALALEQDRLSSLPQPSTNRMVAVADGKIDIKLSEADVKKMNSGEELYFVLGGANGIDISSTPVAGASNFALRHQDINWGKSSIVVDTKKGTVDFNTNKGTFNIVDPSLTTMDYVNRVDYGHKGKVNENAGFYRAFYEPLGIGQEWDKFDAQREAALVEYGRKVREAAKKQADYNAAVLEQKSAIYGEIGRQVQLAKDLGYTIDINPDTGEIKATPPSEPVLYIRAKLLEQGTPYRGSTTTNQQGIYLPASGTENFVAAGANKWGGNVTVLGTGNITHPLIKQTDYGTLYKTDKGAWYIITPKGQMPQSGSSGSPIPSIQNKMTSNASLFIGARKQMYNYMMDVSGRGKTRNRKGNLRNVSKPTVNNTNKQRSLIYPIPKLTTLQSLAGEDKQTSRRKKKRKRLVKSTSVGIGGSTRIEKRMSRNVNKFLGC